MTVSEAISAFRSKLTNLSFDDDSMLTDELLFRELSDAASVVFDRYKAKFNKVSPWMFSTYGIKLEMTDKDFFPCVDIEHCQVLQSVHEIPESLMGRNAPLFKVYNGDEELDEYHPANSYDDYLSTKPQWKLVNSKLRIHNNKKLKAVTVKTIPADITQWYDKQYCPDSDEVICFDLDTMKFPLLSDRKYASMTYDLALQSLRLTIQNLNDQNPQH